MTTVSLEVWRPEFSEVLAYKQTGLTNILIAKKLGKSEGWVSEVVNNPIFKERQKTINDAIKERLSQKLTEKLDNSNVLTQAMDEVVRAVPEAVKMITKLARGGENEDKMRYEASCKILDLAGFKAIERTVERSYSVEELKSANSVLKETITISERLTNLNSRFVLRSIADRKTEKGPETDDNPSGTGEDRQAREPEKPLLSL